MEISHAPLRACTRADARVVPVVKGGPGHGVAVLGFIGVLR